MVIHCYILYTFRYNNVFSQSAPSGPIELPKFNQGLKSFNKDISRTVGQILKIRPPSILQIQFSITFILCKFTIFLLLRVLNYKKLFLDNPRPGQIWIQQLHWDPFMTVYRLVKLTLESAPALKYLLSYNTACNQFWMNFSLNTRKFTVCIQILK